MCGRYTIAKPEKLRVTFEPEVVTADLGRPRYNIAPAQNVPVVALIQGKRALFDCRWGMVPAGPRGRTESKRIINARAETAASKPTFSSAFRNGRCLIPADGFYEWRTVDGRKQPVLVRVGDGVLFAMAGLFDGSRSEDADDLPLCAILTTAANCLMRPVHHRMPVILREADWYRWIDPSLSDPALLKEMLGPFDGGRMNVRAVSTMVNSPANDNEHCMDPL